MKALTISQPYASQIASGEKWVENRKWSTNYRGGIAIHAGLGTQYLSAKKLAESGLPHGAVIAVADLVACVSIEWAESKMHDDCRDHAVVAPGIFLADLLWHEHTEGPWCWVLANVQAITPVPWKGAQGLWGLPDDFAQQPVGA